MPGEIYSRPASAWQRPPLDSLTRTFRTPRVEEPTGIVTNNFKIGQAVLITRYAQRMLIESNISEAIQLFHLDALSSMVGLKVDFHPQLTLMAQRMGREYERDPAVSFHGRCVPKQHHLIEVLQNRMQMRAILRCLSGVLLEEHPGASMHRTERPKA